MLLKILFFAISLLAATWSTECLNPAITSWINSTGYGYGSYSSIRANVMKIYYTNTRVYINVNSMPSYSIGPWPKNPNTPSAKNYIVSFPLSPSSASTKTATSLGVTGFFTNGVSIYNAWDGTSYNTVWQQNAYYFEGVSFGVFELLSCSYACCGTNFTESKPRFMLWSPGRVGLLSQPFKPSVPVRLDKLGSPFSHNRVCYGWLSNLRPLRIFERNILELVDSPYFAQLFDAHLHEQPENVVGERHCAFVVLLRT